MRGLTPPRQRCDAKQPCTTCVNGNRGAGCTYELPPRPRPAGTGVFIFVQARAPDSPNAGNLPSQAPANVPSSALTSPPRDLPLVTWSDSSESGPSHSQFPAPPTPIIRSSPDFSPRIHDKILPGPSSDVSVRRKTHDTTISILRPTVSSFTVLPSIHFQIVPRPLRTPFSLIPPERVQVSSVAGSDLDMTLCVFFPVS